MIDIDCKNGVNGWEAFDHCLELYGELPGPTRSVSTPSGGCHLYFRVRDGIEVRNSSGKLGASIDVRAAGGYVLAPPSTIAGKPYTRDCTSSAKTLPDPWLEAMTSNRSRDVTSSATVQHGTAYGRGALPRAGDELAAAPRGTRNDALNTFGFSMGTLVGAGALLARDVREAAQWACGTWPASERNPKKDAATFERGFQAGLGRPRELICDRATHR